MITIANALDRGNIIAVLLLCVLLEPPIVYIGASIVELIKNHFKGDKKQ